MNEPPRLFESDPAARDAIDAARSDMPDAKRLAKIGAAAAAAATVTGAAATASAGSALAVKIIAGVVLVGAVVGGGYAMTRTPTPAASVSATATATAPIPSVAATVSAAVTVTVTASVSASSTVPGPVPPPLPVDEMALLDEAQKALGSDPAQALSLCDKDVSANPKGTMAQEREVIAIDALMRLHREPQARVRAEKFHSAWPDSAHGRRVDALVNLH